MNESLQTLVALAEQKEELRPGIKAVVELLYMVGSEAGPAVSAVVGYFADQQAAMVDRLQVVHGFSREEAILLTIDAKVALKEALANTRKGQASE